MIIKAASDAIVPGLASSEVPDPQGTSTVIATIVDTLDTVLELSKMHENRLKQISTLMSKSAFTPERRRDMEADAQIFRHERVDRNSQNLHRSRLTRTDVKTSYTKEQNDVMLDTTFDPYQGATQGYLGAQRKPRSAAAGQELSIASHELSSGPRAQQHNTQGKPVYLYLPEEWYLTDWLADQSDESKAYFREARDGDIVWRLDGNLYGRRTACAVYRKELREILTVGLKPKGFQFEIGVKDPCTYRCKSSHVRLLHHIDDFRSTGEAAALKALFNTEFHRVA